MKKRANHEGSLFFSERDGWVGEIVLPNGKKRRKQSKQQRVVRDWLSQQKESLAKGTWVDDENVKYADFLDRYMNEIAAHSLRPKTQETYYFMIKNHIKPALGDLRLVQIRPQNIQSLYSSMLNKGLSKATVLYVHAVIHKTLQTAVTWDMLSRNPADAVKPDRPDKHPITPLSVTDAKKFLEVLEGDRLYTFYVLLIATGMRKGEVLGLQKSDVNLTNGTVTVNHSLGSVRGKGLILGIPKSEQSRRVLVLPEFALEALKKHLNTSGESPFVFATGNDTPFSPRNVLRHFKEALKRAGLPQETRIHDLRHSFISWLLATGTPPKDVQLIAGHSQFAVTMDLYGHMMPGAQKEAARKIEGLFDPQEPH